LKWKKILFSVGVLLFLLTIIRRLIGLIPFDKLFPLIKEELCLHYIFWILIGISLLLYLLYKIKPIISFIKKVLCSLKYKWCSYAVPKKENPCDFSPEKPLNPSDKDELGVEHIIDRIYETIINYAGDESLTIGIDGELGIGKTSLMNLVKGKFKEEKDFVLVFFDPWHYGDQRVLINGFLSAIYSAINNKTGLSLFKWGSQAKGFSQALEFTVSAGPVSMKVPMNTLSINEAKDEFEKQYLELGLKMIVFIDDLDRCDKDEALLVLKLLREFANLKRTFFIIGYDKERLRKTIDMDIEKFVDQEIPLNIEQFKLWEWFWEKAKKCIVLYDNLRDALENDVIKNDFSKIFSQYCYTPRKTKQLLNDLLLALPVVKDNVYFPHFAIVSIMRRDIPNLYNYLAQGGYWILQEGLYKSYGEFPTRQLSEKEIDNIVNNLSNNDERLRSRIFQYLDVLSADIESRVNLDTGKVELSMEDLIWRSKRIIEKDEKNEKKQILPEISDKKVIWRKGCTETYFIWRPPYFVYTDKSFELLLRDIKNLSDEQDKITKLLLEVKRMVEEDKLDNFLSIVRRKLETIFKEKLSVIFLKGLAQVKSQNDLIVDFVKTVLEIMWLYPKELRLKMLVATIENTANPGFLSKLYRDAEVRNRISNWFQGDDFKNTISPKVEERYDEILGKEPTCFCEFGIGLDKILFLVEWRNAEKVAKYLKDLEKKHANCAEILSAHIERASDGGHIFFKDVYDKSKKLNRNVD